MFKGIKSSVKLKLPSIVLCGYERGGTTVLSDIFRNNGYESGFECGVLMCDTPRDFLKYKPYVDMLMPGWGINSCELEAICCSDFKNFYDQLISKSNSTIREANKFFDKTPIYMSKLGRVLNRTGFINKACIIHRDPRAVFSSWAKRHEPNAKETIEQRVLKNLDNFCKRYIHYFMGCAAHFNNPNVFFVPFEDLCDRQEFYYKQIGLFADSEEFSPLGKKSRFSNVDGTGIDSSKAVEFEQHLSEDLQIAILEKTRIASPFFGSKEARDRFGDYWDEIHLNIQEVLTNFDINKISYMVNERYFEPSTYLLRHADVLSARVDPIEHYQNFGINEDRSPD